MLTSTADTLGLSRRWVLPCSAFSKGAAQGSTHQHTAEPTLKRRANSILNWDDEAALRKGVEYGNTPGQVHVSLSKEEIKRLKAAGEDILRHKREEGGLKGAQTRRCHVCHVSCVYSALIPSASHWNTENTVFRLYPLCILFPGASYSIPLVS